MQRRIQPYPSPTSTQNHHTASPFFTQHGNDAAPLPDGLQQLRDHDPSRTDGASYGGTALMGTAAESAEQFAPQPPMIDGNGQQQVSAEHLAQNVLTIEQQQRQPTSEQSSSRRKPKTSKACDECRRKKIRCDITTDNPTNPCSACRRSGSVCQFSRQQLKRGPSKGYIKELADRLNSLESQLGPQPHQFAFAGSPYAFTQAPEGQMQEQISPQQNISQPDPTAASRKRKLSDDHAARPSSSVHSNHPATGQSDHSTIHGETYRSSGPDIPEAHEPLSIRSTPPRSPAQQVSSAAPGGGSIWRYSVSNTSRRETVGVPYGPEQREAEGEALQGWDDVVVEEYYRLIHQSLPLLPHSKLRLRSRLVHCPPTLREAFLVALDTAIRETPTSQLSPIDTFTGARKAAALIAASQFENTSNRSMSANLIYIQTLILMALESDHHGPATMRGQIGPPRAEWLGRAVGMAMHLKLNTLYPKDRFGEGDPDADEKLGRRVWWILFILDRWHASSTSQLLQLPENSSSLLLEDQILLGESTYHLVRLSYILGHLSAILQQPPSLMSRESAAAPIITTTILGELDRFRESVESVLLGAPNLVHLTYWHVRLMVLRLTSSTTAQELLTPATRMASILNSSYTPLTPLNHHFAALASLTLVELADFEDTREGAKRGIDDIAEAHSSKRGFMSKENSTGWDGAIRELVVKRQAQIEGRVPTAPGDSGGGLRHLADAATGGQPDSESASIGSAFDPTLVTRYGYLAALVQENRM